MTRRAFGSVRVLPSKRFQGRYRDINGTEHSQTFPTRKQASAWLAAAEADLDRGIWRDPEAGKITFKDYSASWIDARVDLKATTRANYIQLLRRVLVPQLGAVALSDLTPIRIRKWYAELARTAKPTPTRQCYALLRAILNTAVGDDLLIRNPCRIRGAGVPKHAERPIATLDQITALADAIHPPYRALVLTAAWTGARWGELIALTRDRLDLSTGRMVIDRQYVLIKGDGGPTRIQLETPKTAAGKRSVHIPPHLLPVLAAHLLEHVPPGCELVFPNGKGEPLHRGAFQTVWHRARTRAGLPQFHFHDLRHTGNTLAASTGASIRELMHRMGHSSMRAALIYQHATDERDEAIAAALSDLAVKRTSELGAVRRIVSPLRVVPDQSDGATG